MNKLLPADQDHILTNAMSDYRNFTKLGNIISTDIGAAKFARRVWVVCEP